MDNDAEIARMKGRREAMASQTGTAKLNARADQTRTGHVADKAACERCGGLMVQECFEDLWDEPDQSCFDARRCVQCGNILDAVIERNRLHPEQAVDRPNKWASDLSIPILTQEGNQISGQSAAQSTQAPHNGAPSGGERI